MDKWKLWEVWGPTPDTPLKVTLQEGHFLFLGGGSLSIVVVVIVIGVVIIVVIVVVIVGVSFGGVFGDSFGVVFGVVFRSVLKCNK